MRWVLIEQKNPSLAASLANELHIPPIISQIFINRGLTTSSQLKSFLYPSLSDLSSPFLLPGMKKAVDRIVRALREKEKIVVFGDYDVDGITATALIYSILQRFGADVMWYLPDRLIEGYGLSQKGIDDAVQRGASLLISVDCGITGVETVEYGKTKEIECIITDHHEPGDKLPDAVAVVDPKINPNCDVSCRELAGVAVAYKLADALYEYLNEDKSFLHQQLDLVGLGVIADIVPLTGENRILAKYGLRMLETSSKPGIKALLQVSGLWGNELSSWHIVFVLAPRLNAVGRIGDPSVALKLLLASNYDEALQIARILEEENKRRKELDEKTFEEAVCLAERTMNPNDKAIVLMNENWHLGVIGIVASRLVEKYNKPVVLISTIDGTGKGSARSIPSFHLLDAIRNCGDILEKYGGHKYAAGLSISPEKVPEFRRRFLAYASQHLSDSDLIPTLSIDTKLLPEELNPELINWLELFAPYGPENMRPVFLMENIEVLGEPKIVGDNHIRFQIRNSQSSFNVIGFGFGEFLPALISKSKPVHLAVVVDKNTHFDPPEPQLRIKDIKIGNWQSTN